MSMTELMYWFDKVRVEMRAVLERVDPEREVYPGWSMKENIAHITGWEEVTIKSLRALKAGTAPYILPPKSIDAHNDDMVRTRVSMSFEEVLREWEGIRAGLIAAIAGLSEGDFEKWITFPWGPEGTVRDLLAIIADHEGEHARELRRA